MVSGFNDFWYESGTVQDLVIRNNVFEDLGMETCNVPILEIEGTLNDESKPLYAKP